MLEVENLTKSYLKPRGKRRLLGKAADEQPMDENAALKGASFEVADGDMFTLLGPSGSGKSTMLRSIAGLERPDRGRIKLCGRTLFDRMTGVNVPPSVRGLGMVFQSYAIWPHMDVFKNVSFPLDVTKRRRKVDQSEIRKRVERLLDMMGLASLGDRPATDLSGGQQQRLALARAFVTEPELMLLDEPLSNLDAKLRESMRIELRGLQQRLGQTSIYVTHDQEDALSMSSMIAVVNEGRIVQIGTPREIYTQPNCKFVAEFIGSSGFIRGDVVSGDSQSQAIQTATGEQIVVNNRDLSVGRKAWVHLRPEDVVLHTSQPSADVPNVLSGTLKSQSYTGDAMVYTVEIGESEVPARGRPRESVQVGDEVWLSVAADDVGVLPLEER